MKRLLLGGLIIASLGLGTLWFWPAKAEPQVSAAVVEKEQSLLELVNEVRAKDGKPALTEDPQLDASAQAKVDDQVARNYWSHKPPTGEGTFFLLYKIVGHKATVAENIAKCQTTNKQRVNDWVHSPTHYEAMIGDYDKFGWAVAINPQDMNCTYTVTYFMKTKK